MRFTLIFISSVMILLSACSKKNMPLETAEKKEVKSMDKPMPEATTIDHEEENFAEDISDQLGLSEEQSKRIKEIQQKYRDKIIALRNENTDNRMKLLKDIDSLRNLEENEIRQILNREQYKKYSQQRKQQSGGQGRMPGQ